MLFVYGSLKRGERHHRELRGARFVAEARTAPGYGLVPLGPYVALVEAPGRTTGVAGELFEVEETLLPALDEFEGEDYERRAVAVADDATAGGHSADAAVLAYFKSPRAQLNDR